MYINDLYQIYEVIGKKGIIPSHKKKIKRWEKLIDIKIIKYKEYKFYKCEQFRMYESFLF